MKTISLCALLAACGGRAATAPTSTPPPSSPTTTKLPGNAAPAAATRASAERALQTDLPLAYEHPFDGKQTDRSETIKLFQVRCADGDEQGCIVESELMNVHAPARVSPAVEKNCRAGHMLSCRALPFDFGPARYPDLPGATSRSDACSRGVSASCDSEKLQRECKDGFARACLTLGLADTSAGGDALIAQSWKFSIEGCRAGIADDCEYAKDPRNKAYQQEAAERLCDLRPSDCASLADRYTDMHETTKARDALERACQYGSVENCLDLGAHYLAGTMAEPVVGRGQALVDWACPKLLEKGHGTLRRSLAEKCKSASH